MPQPFYVIEIRYADGSVERHEIRDAKRILGRSKIKADLQVADAKVSGAHSEFRFEGGELTVRDLGSTNGTHFHGTRMQGDFQLLPGESCKVGDAAIHLISIEGVETDAAKTMVGAPMWHEDEESTRALDASALQALERGAPPSPAPKSAVSAPAPAPRAEAPAPASKSNDWSAAYASSEDRTPPGGAPLPPASKVRAPAAPPVSEVRSARAPAASMAQASEQLANPRKGLRWLLVALSFVVALVTIGASGLRSYDYVLNRDPSGFIQAADTEIAVGQARLQAAKASGELSEEDAAVQQGWIDFYQKYRNALVRVGWGILGIGGLSVFLLIGAFLRGTGFSWVLGALGVVGGGVLAALTPQFDFSLVTSQPQTVAAAITGAFALQFLLALGANTLGRRARLIEESA